MTRAHDHFGLAFQGDIPLTHGATVISTDGMGTRIPRYVEERDFKELKQLVEYLDLRLIEVERELLELRMKTPGMQP